MKIVNRYIGVTGGYLGDFSYRTHADFYPEYCDLEIDPHRYEGTTRQRFIAIISEQEPWVQARIVRGVTERFPVDGPASPPTRTKELRSELLKWADRLHGIVVNSTIPRTSRADVSQAITDTETLLQSRSGAPVSGREVRSLLSRPSPSNMPNAECFAKRSRRALLHDRADHVAHSVPSGYANAAAVPGRKAVPAPGWVGSR